MEAVIYLALGEEDQIAIVGTGRLILFGAVLVVSPDVDVDISVDAFLVKEMDLEARVAVPFQVNFPFQIV